MQCDEWLRISKVLKFLKYITFIKTKESRPSESPHENERILLSVMNKFCNREFLMHIPRNKCVGRRRLRRALNNLSKGHVFINDEYLYQHGRE